MSLFLAKPQRLASHINSRDFAIARITLQPRQIATGAGTIIKNLTIYPGWTYRIEQGRGTFVNPATRWSPLDPTLLMARAGSTEGAGDLAVKLTEARRLVEVGVSGLAAQRRTEQDLVELGRALDRMREASDRDDVDGFTKADLEFHQAVMAAAGNPFITALFEPLVDLLFEVRRAASGYRPGRETAIAAHRKVLEAIEHGVPDAARDAMGLHMQQTAERINEVVEQDGLRLALPPPRRA